MMKKAVKTGENPEESKLNLEVDPDFEEVDLKKVSLSLSYKDRVSEFIRRNELLEVSKSYYLYKFDSVQSGQQKAFIAKYVDNEEPDEDQIGKEFGSGRYLVVMAIPECEKAPEGFMRAYQIRIHPHYDILRNKRLAEVASPVPQTTIIQAPTNNMGDSIDMITKLIAAIAPLLAPKPQQGPDMSTLLFKTFENTQEVLKKNMMENVKVNSDLQRKLMSIDNGGGEEVKTDTQEESLIEALKPFLMEYLPKLLGSNAQAKAVQQLVKTTPQFQRIVSNKREFKTLVAYLDQQQGTEITDKILSNLKLKRAV